MKVLDHEPQWWFLLEDEGTLYLDVNCNHSFIGYDFLLQLDAGEVEAFRTEGHDYISKLADDIQNSAPILAASNSRYKGRNRSNEFSDRVIAAIKSWRDDRS